MSRIYGVLFEWNTRLTCTRLINFKTDFISNCALPAINNHVPLSINESFKKKKLPIKNHTAIKKSLNAPSAS